MREFEKIKKHKNKAEYREMNAEYLIEILTDALFALRNDEYSSKKRPEDGYCVEIKKHKNKAEYREMNAEYLIEILTDALFALRNDEYSSKKRPEDGYCVV